MLDWLTSDWDLFGVTGQNWMWLIGAGLLFYIAVLVIPGRRQNNAH
jgi:hypothetical protein